MVWHHGNIHRMQLVFLLLDRVPRTWILFITHCHVCLQLKEQWLQKCKKRPFSFLCFQEYSICCVPLSTFSIKKWHIFIISYFSAVYLTLLFFTYLKTIVQTKGKGKVKEGQKEDWLKLQPKSGAELQNILQLLLCWDCLTFRLNFALG